jgi:hypothetical protein
MQTLTSVLFATENFASFARLPLNEDHKMWASIPVLHPLAASASLSVKAVHAAYLRHAQGST